MSDSIGVPTRGILQGTVMDSQTCPIRILLVDDHALFLVGVRSLIEDDRGLTVVGEATNRAEALRSAEQRATSSCLILTSAANSVWTSYRSCCRFRKNPESWS